MSHDCENFLPFRVGLEFIWKTVLTGVQLSVQLRLLAKENPDSNRRG
jgi:hypothetical protein